MAGSSDEIETHSLRQLIAEYRRLRASSRRVRDRVRNLSVQLQKRLEIFGKSIVKGNESDPQSPSTPFGLQ